MVPRCKAFLLCRLAEWNLPPGGTWTFLFHNNYHPHYSNINLLWFHNGDKFPRVVTKLYPEPQLPTREFANLTHAYSHAPQWVPRPRHLGEEGQFWAIWMEGVAGSPLCVGMAHPADRLRSVVRMIASLHAATAVRTAGSAVGRFQRLVVAPLQAVAQFGDSVYVREGCAALAASVPEAWLDSLPVLPQHGDLCGSNVLVHKAQAHIVDWENFGAIDLPFYDVVTLLLSVAPGATPDRWDVAFQNAVPRLLGEYARQLGLPLQNIAQLLPLILANWFYLHWQDGREEFTKRMYGVIRNYFENQRMWEAAWSPGTRS